MKKSMKKSTKNQMKRKLKTNLVKLSNNGKPKVVKKSVISSHKSDKKPKPLYKCGYDGCDKTYKDRYNLTRHENRDHLKAEYLVCEYPNCSFKTYHRPMLDKHISINHTKNYDRKHKCTYDGCKKKYERKRDLLRHENIVHLKLGKFFCLYPNCVYHTYDKVSYEKHIANHDNYAELSAQTYSCDFEGCDKEFAQKKSWVRHREIYHLYRVPCSYPGCEFTAMSDAHLKVHMVKHTNETPFGCDVEGCGRRFKYEHTYKNHLDLHKNKFFKCTFEGMR